MADVDADSDCPECGSGDTYLAELTHGGEFAGAEFQCYGCGHSMVMEP